MVPLPDQYRGQHHYSDEEASIKYAESVKSQIAKLESEGRRLAAFICEPYFVESGVHPPTSQYYQQVYRWVKSHFFLALSYFLIFQCSESSWWSGYCGWGIVQKYFSLFLKFILRVGPVLAGLESTCGASKALEWSQILSPLDVPCPTAILWVLWYVPGRRQVF